MEHLKVRTRRLGTDINLDPIVLASPQVADEGSVAARVRQRKSVGFHARQGLDVVLVGVSHKCAKATLVGRSAWAGLAELGAFRVRVTLVGALVPSVHDVVGLLVVLGNDEAGVEVQLAKLVLVE